MSPMSSGMLKVSSEFPLRSHKIIQVNDTKNENDTDIENEQQSLRSGLYRGRDKK